MSEIKNHTLTSRRWSCRFREERYCESRACRGTILHFWSMLTQPFFWLIY